MACVNDESRLSFSASSSGRYLSSFSILSLRRVSLGATEKKRGRRRRRKKKTPTIIEKKKKKKVVQLCNYGVPRILCADCALHVATGRFLRRSGPLLCVFVVSSNQLAPSLQQQWLDGKWENKSGERLEEQWSDSSRRKWAQKDVALRTDAAYCVRCECAPPPVATIPLSDFQHWHGCARCTVWCC